MSEDPDPPGPAFDQFVGGIGERPRYRPARGRWWHWLPLIGAVAAVLAAAVWKVGRIVGLW